MALSGGDEAWSFGVADGLFLVGLAPSVASTESPEAELRRLRKENREVQARCEILKNGGHLQRSVVERYGAIRKMKTDHAITL